MDDQHIFDLMEKAILDGDDQGARQGAREAIQLQIDPLEVVDKGLSKGMKIVGDRFESGDAFLPELLMAADTFNAAMELLRPELKAQKKEVSRAGKVVIATIKGDVHDIGKNIVATILDTRGISVVDLGIDVPSLDIIEAAQRERADIIALSCLMTTTMTYQREVINALLELGLREKYLVIVGGGPVTREWANEIGADGYAPNANGAATLVKELLETKISCPVN